MGEALRDWPGGWVGEGSSGATESYARSAVTAGAVALHFVCQIHDHCVNGQRVVVHVRCEAPELKLQVCTSDAN